MSDGGLLTKEQIYILKIIRGECIQEISSNLDYRYILNYALEGKFYIWLYRQIYQFIPLQYKDLYRNEYLKLNNRNHMQQREMKRIVSYFNARGLKYAIVKGNILSQIIFDDYSMRQSSDIDIIVYEDELNVAYQYLRELGYKFCAGYDYKRKALDLLESPYFLYYHDYHEYQCAFEVEDGEWLKVEIKRNSSAISCEYIKDFLQARELVRIGEIQYVTFDLKHTLLHLFANIYENIEEERSILKGRYFRDIIDLFFYMEKYNDIKWDMIFYLSEKYEMTHKIYAVMNIFNSVYVNYFSHELCEIFNPRFISYKYDGNDDGQRFFWKSNFLVRAFNKDIRLSEYSTNKKNEIFGGKDIDLTTKIYFIDKRKYILTGNIGLNNEKNFRVTLRYEFVNRKFFFFLICEAELLNSEIFPFISFCNNSNELYKEIYFDFNDYTFSTNSSEGVIKITNMGEYNKCQVELGKEELFESGNMICCLLEFRKKIGNVGFCRVSDIYKFFINSN